MADNLSPLVNLDLINQIYKTINAQITERVYDPAYNPEVELGSEGSKYKSAWIDGNTSTGTLNGLTLKKADTGIGFVISGGTTSKALTVGDAATINKPLEVTAATSITGSLTVSAATNIVKSLTVGAAETYTGAVTVRSKGAGSTTITGPDGGEAELVDGVYTSIVKENFNTANIASTLVKRDQNGNILVSKVNGVALENSTASFTVTGGSATSKTLTVNSVATLGSSTTSENGSVTVKSAGTSFTTIIGPNGKEAKLIDGIYTTSATTENSIAPTENKLLKITKVSANTFLAGPESGSNDVPNYRSIKASDLPKAGADASGIVTTDAQTFEGAKTFNKTIIGDINGNAGTATKLETVRSFKIADADNTNTSAAGADFDGTESVTLNLPATIKATLTGNADTASQVETVKASTSTDANHYISFVSSDNDTATAETVYTSSKLTYNPSTGALEATKLTGKLAVSNITGTLGVEHGGTGINSFKAGDILYASGDTTLSVLSKGDKGQVLKMGETSPTWSTDITPTTFAWTDGTTEGPTGSLSGKDMSDVKFAAIPSASDTTSGIITTGPQSFKGAKTFVDTTDSADNESGAVIISGGLGVAKNIYAAAVHNAVWNDLIDCMEVPENTSLEYGYCYSWEGTSVIKSSRSSKNCIGIHSNTAGFAMGEKKTKTIRAAVAGFVLAYVDKLYPEGTPLTWGNDGVLTKCRLLKRVLHPERVIATFYREEKEEKWHDLPVSGRHWVKVK